MNYKFQVKKTSKGYRLIVKKYVGLNIYDTIKDITYTSLKGVKVAINVILNS